MVRTPRPDCQRSGSSYSKNGPNYWTMTNEPNFFARYSSIAAAAQRRRHGRVVCQGIDCALGPVQDLSASGMRVYALCKPPGVGTQFGMTLHTLDGPVDLGCTVAWIRRIGLNKHEVGLEFVDLPPFVRQSLARIARCASQNETVLPSLREFHRDA